MSSIYCNFSKGVSEKRQQEIIKEIDSMIGVYDVRRRNQGYNGPFDFWVYIAPRPWVENQAKRVEEIARELREIEEIESLISDL